MSNSVMPETWAAIDMLGRQLPTALTVGEPRKDRYVGLFYWIWHCHPYHSGSLTFAEYTLGRSNEETMRKSPEARNDYHHPAWDGCEYAHWNESVYGYYRSYDKWVIRKHAEMLADAGVDVIIFDCTNGQNTFDPGWEAVAEVFHQARLDGVNCPGIAFLLPLHWPYFDHNAEDCRQDLRHLYEKLYKPNRYPELYFHWKGKPLVMGYPDGLDKNDPLDAEILDYFTFRPCEPTYTKGQQHPDQWGWLSTTPQPVYRNADGTPEQMTVGVAQNHNERYGLTAMSGPDVFGRTYTTQGFDTSPNAKLKGANFQEQWDYALKVDPEFIFVTGWNEGLACRTEEWNHVTNAFWDQFNDINSRDCEPSKGDLKDAYYYQLCANIRRFKGVPMEAPAAAAQKLDLSSSRESWHQLARGYAHYPHNTGHRNQEGYGRQYVNNTGRNDIVSAAMSHDETYIYASVTCSDRISPKTDNSWMRLYLRTRQESASWEGFHFVVNRLNPGEKAWLEKSQGGWQWHVVEGVDYALDNDRLTIRIPRAPLGLDTPDFKVWFKWSDNQGDGDIMSVYTDGDAAPGGRFTFYYHGTDR